MPTGPNIPIWCTRSPIFRVWVQNEAIFQKNNYFRGITATEIHHLPSKFYCKKCSLVWIVREPGQDNCFSAFLKELGHSKPQLIHRIKYLGYLFADPVNFSSWNWPGAHMEGTMKLGSRGSGWELRSQFVSLWGQRSSLGYWWSPVTCVCLLPGQADLWAAFVCCRWVNPESRRTHHPGFLYLWRTQDPVDKSEGLRNYNLPRTVPRLH